MAYKSVFLVVGVLLVTLAAAMMIPVVVNLTLHACGWEGFALSAAATGFVGILIILTALPSEEEKIQTREAFLLTALCWVTICIFAALPFVWSISSLSFTDALFEATAALTTTGTTVLTTLEKASQGMLIWRALLQWLGGIGIIVMALTILPALKIGGMQLFRTESSDRSEKILPRASQIAAALLSTYAFLTLVCGGLLWFAGMSVFEALCHAMAALATGGLSTSNQSIAHFNSPLIEAILIVFMVIGGGTIILFVKAWHGDIKALGRDSQIRAYVFILVAASGAITLWQWQVSHLLFSQALRHSIFNVVSVVTTSGFSSTDYASWGTFPITLLFLLSFIGGCTGSTAGGIKIFRLQVLLSVARAQIAQLRRPHGVFIPTYSNRPIAEAVVSSVFTFFALYTISYACISLALSLCGLDLLSCLSGAGIALGNGGAGFGKYFSPTGVPSLLPASAKWVLMVAMIVGRLELMTVLILFLPSFWRK